MRQLTRSEKRLFQLLLFLTFLIVNLLGWPFLWHQQKAIQEELHLLYAEQFSGRSWIINKNLWNARHAWIAEKQPKLVNPGEASSSLLENLQKTARNHRIDILEQSFSDSQNQPSYQEVGVKLKVSGSLEAIVRWINEIQQPEHFQAIQNLSLKSGTTPAIVTCELSVARWYAPRSNFP